MQRLIRSVCAIAAEECGKERAMRIGKTAQKRYKELCEENRSDPKALKAHTFRRIYPAIAVYEAMQADGISKEKAFFYIHEYYQRVAFKIAPSLRRMIRISGMARKVPGLFMKIVPKSFGEDAGFRYVFPPASKNEVRANFIRCPYFETCRRYGCPEITTAFCDADDAAYGDLHPDLLWGRIGTIGRGNECCDFLLRYTGAAEGTHK